MGPSMRTLHKLHKWCGLIVAAVLLLQVLTGLVLIFHWELARIVDPRGMQRHSADGAVPLAAVEDAMRVSLPDHSLSRLVFPKHEAATYFARLIDAEGNVRYASVDPGTGEILRSGAVWSFPLEALVQLHFNLMAGLSGLVVAFAVAIVTCGLIVAGIVLWWPRGGRFREAFRIHWGRKLRFVLVEVHRVIGAATAPLLLLVASTGAVLVFEPLLAGNISPPPLSPAIVRSMPVTLDLAVYEAGRQFPGAEIYDVRRTSDSRIYVLFRAPEVGPRAVHFVGIDAASNEVVDVARAGERTNAAFYMLPLHTGEQFGVVGQALQFIAGLSFVLLIASALTTWFKRRRPSNVTAKGST